MRLKDKVAMVTGAAHGMGEAGARLFAKEGARVVVAVREEAMLPPRRSTSPASPNG
jgi:NAD(P)-dependent dehydrogenase (short-subunit alcohol dehydrogenase family)